MNKETQKKGTLESDPRELLEQVLMTEIEIAGNIADSREKADHAVLEAQANTAKLKNRILEKARQERDQFMAEGLKKARDASEKKIEQSENEAREFLAKGNAFVNEASSRVMEMLLGLVGGDQQ